MAGINYFDSNRTIVTNTAILKFEAVKVMRCYGIFKMVKLGIKKLKAKLWLKLWLKIPKGIFIDKVQYRFYYK